MHGMDMAYPCCPRRGNMGYFFKINEEEHVTLRLKSCTQIIVELK